jgi:Ca-activated chloride channel family protein
VGISFAAPRYLLALPVLAVLLVAFLIARARHKARLATFAEPDLLGMLVAKPPSWVTVGAPLLCVGAMGLLLVALARPQTGIATVEFRARDMDIILAVDLSASMLAPDVPPDRLEVAKLAGTVLLETLTGERVGILGFAGDAFLACPLTADYASARMFLDALDPAFLSQPGTSLARAVNVAIESFPGGTEALHVVIVISDGEDHEGGVQAASQTAETKGARVFCLGVGTTDGDLIPVDPKTSDYKRDSNGRPVLTRLNEESLVRLALGTGGKYYRLRRGEPEVEALVRDLRSLPAPTIKRKQAVEGAEWFEYPLGCAGGLLVLVLSGRLIRPRQPVRRSRWGDRG